MGQGVFQVPDCFRLHAPETAVVNRGHVTQALAQRARGPSRQRLGAMEGKDTAAAGMGVAGVGEVGFDTDVQIWTTWADTWGSPWPQDDFTIADNRADLEYHYCEHRERVAFTYTALNPDATACLGCVYVKPLATLIATATTNPEVLADVGEGETAVRFWVTQPYLADNLDRRLLQTLVTWFQDTWAFERVLFHTREANRQQLALFAQAGLRHVCTLNLPRRGGLHQFWGWKTLSGG